MTKFPSCLGHSVGLVGLIGFLNEFSRAFRNLLPIFVVEFLCCT